MTTFKQRIALGAISFSFALAPACGMAQASFPSKPIHLVVPFGVGGAGDQLARALAKAIADAHRVTVVVENKVGAGGGIGAAYVARSRADGYTVLLGTNTTQVANRYLFKSLPYDPARDFDPVTAVSRGDQLLLVRPGSGIGSVADLVKRARERPGQVSYGSGSSSSQVATSMFEREAGVKLLFVPYKSNSLAVTDLLSGQIDMMITDTATGLGHVRQGTLKALAVTGDARVPEVPDVPTVREVLGNDYSAMPWFNALYVPRGTPPDIVARLNRLFVEATSSPEADGFYRSSGSARFVTSPAELATFQAGQDRLWKDAIEAAGIDPV
ncbi:tripartite tricarboxylate transporter substrate binding protein [Pigmentiphaga soli]|uniref:Tripartite tricarboxylate transporter substrate binding protein n=1 Tax=Pigmentiphaga soli TaxID=1007095 RepID=A0ABP8GKS1_9BURK